MSPCHLAVAWLYIAPAAEAPLQWEGSSEISNKGSVPFIPPLSMATLQVWQATRQGMSATAQHCQVLSYSGEPG
jgi:hypothetical protein